MILSETPFDDVDKPQVSHKTAGLIAAILAGSFVANAGKYLNLPDEEDRDSGDEPYDDSAE